MLPDQERNKRYVLQEEKSAVLCLSLIHILKLELTGLNKETQIQDILADSLVRCIWDHLSFQVTEGGGLTENVGISAEFPARWNNTIKETGICTNFQGDRLGYLSVTAVKPADPEEAAALCPVSYTHLHRFKHLMSGCLKGASDCEQT